MGPMYSWSLRILAFLVPLLQEAGGAREERE
jgi:hypothetical protein